MFPYVLVPVAEGHVDKQKGDLYSIPILFYLRLTLHALAVAALFFRKLAQALNEAMSLAGQQTAPEEATVGSDEESETRAIPEPLPAAEKRLDPSNARPDRRGPVVYRIQLMRAFPFYGFCPTERFFAKILLLQPAHVLRVAHLLRSGAVLGTSFSVYEVRSPPVPSIRCQPPQLFRA
jgi:hypothetical protein